MLFYVCYPKYTVSDEHAASLEGIKFKRSRGKEECMHDLGVGLAGRVWQETEKKEVKK